MSETKKLMIWAGTMIVIALGAFFGALELLPNNESIIAVVAAVAGGAGVVACVGGGGAAAAVAAGAGVAAIITGTVVGVPAGTVIGVAGGGAGIAGVAADILKNCGIPKKQAVSILTAEAVVIFGVMMIKIIPLI